MSQFPLLTLQDILLSKNLNEKRLQIYIKQCQKHNMQLYQQVSVWIQGIVAQLHRILSSQKVDIKTKIHGMYLLKLIVLTCQYMLLYLIQAYLLPYLIDISEFYSNNIQYKLNSKYFQSLGYPSTYINISEVSHNYVVLATEILYTCASIRPKQSFQNKQLTKSSTFYVQMIKIKEKNTKVFQQNSLCTKYSIKELRHKYLHKLNQFQNHTYFYIDFYMKKLQSFIFSADKNTNQIDTLDFKIIFRKGDVYLTSQAIARLSEIIDFVDDFSIKCKALALINQLVLWGDIEAVITINYTDYFQKVFQRINKVNGDKGLKRGQQIYPQIKNQIQQKRKFYSDYLRCLNIWGLCFPTESIIFYDKEQNKNISPVNSSYRQLKEGRKFVFPQNPFIGKIQRQIREKLRQNEQRNNLILLELRNEVLEIQNEYKVSFKEIRESMNQTKQKLLTLKNKLDGNSLDQIMNFVKQFSKNFQKQLQRLAESIDNLQLDDTIEKGLICIQIINIIQPQYHKYRKDRLSLKQFQKICNKKIDQTYFNGKVIDQISLNSSKSFIDKKSQLRNSINSNLNKSRQIKKNISQQDRVKIMKNKYLQRLKKIASRTNSQKDDSFLNVSSFLNTKISTNSRSLNRLPLQSKKYIQANQPVKQKQSVQIDKTQTKALKSPRQNGKKVFIVSKFIDDNTDQDIEIVKNKIMKNNWNSKHIDQNKQRPLIFKKAENFSFLDYQKYNNNEQIRVANSNEQYANQDINIKQISQQNSVTKQYTNYNAGSPNFGNTMIDENYGKLQRMTARKGVGLAKKFINLTDKLIGPSLQIVLLKDYCNYFQNFNSIQKKKDMIQKQCTILDNQLIQVDRVSMQKENKLQIAFYLFPKTEITKIKFRLHENPSVYFNIIENNDVIAVRNFYQINHLKPKEQYTFEIKGTLLKTPIIYPELQIKIFDKNNNQIIKKYSIPFPLLLLSKQKKPSPKWMGKDFQLCNKIISEEIIKNKQIISKFQDFEDYFSQLSEIKTDKNIKKYRTCVTLQKISFILQIKQTDQTLTFQAALLDTNSQSTVIKSFIAQCMRVFF